MKSQASNIANQKREMQRSDSPKMLKPPWWAASLLLQHMVDELAKSRTLSESVKVGIRSEIHSATGITCHSGRFFVFKR